MLTDHRLTIYSVGPDPRAAALERSARHLGLPLTAPVTIADVIHLRGEVDEVARGHLYHVLVDEHLQTGTWATPTTDGVEVTLLPGVTDSVGAAVVRVASLLGIDVVAAAHARRVEFGAPLDDSVRDHLVTALVANPVVDRWAPGPLSAPLDQPDPTPGITVTIDVGGFDDDALSQLSRDRGLALDPDQMRAVRQHFGTLGRPATDAELETIAQTWSEHCAHTTFRATITTTAPDGTVGDRPSLLDALRQCTTDIAAPFVRSAFVGNAGVVEFVPGTTVALKAETHNHPSAIEPFGGANTGVGGVIRDVLGMAHRPIAITDVLCFGPADTDPALVPPGALHPLRIRDGVIAGVADYGNKIGLPTVAGAVVDHAAYTTNPLVFAGCIGTAQHWSPDEGPHAGDRVVVLGGRTGRDGIKGATFSSTTMDATTGTTAGASVQIGDPITEKLLIDVLAEATHLFSAITDCGAGGLSSSVGELADGVGAEVDLTLVPLKYPGLEPWEIWLSEAQERMVLAVHPSHLAELARRCADHGVEMTDLGWFTGDGCLSVRHGDHLVVDLDTEFLHRGRPRRHLPATLPAPHRDLDTRPVVADCADALLRLLAHADLTCRREPVRRYDHEIRGATVVRPLLGVRGDGHADGVVLAEPESTQGIAIGIGVNPHFGELDPEHMAWSVVDEAIRNVVAVGADPDRIALLDNFSFGDPRRATTLGDLVAAVDGCTAAARHFGAPYVSGKDSLNNEYLGADGRRHGVPPTLVITAVAHVDHADTVVTPEPRGAGEVLVLVGRTRAEFGGSHLGLVLPQAAGRCVPAPDHGALERYRRIHRAIAAGAVRSAHDLAEGGLAVAVAEMCVAGRLGADVTSCGHGDTVTGLFSESNGRFVLGVDPERLDEVLTALGDDAVVIGRFTDEPVLRLPNTRPVALDELVTTREPRTS